MKRIVQLNPEDNGGEGFHIIFTKEDNGNKSIEVSTICYGIHNSSIKLSNVNDKGLKELLSNLVDFMKDS